MLVIRRCWCRGLVMTMVAVRRRSWCHCLIYWRTWTVSPHEVTTDQKESQAIWNAVFERFVLATVEPCLEVCRRVADGAVAWDGGY